MWFQYVMRVQTHANSGKGQQRAQLALPLYRPTDQRPWANSCTHATAELDGLLSKRQIRAIDARRQLMLEELGRRGVLPAVGETLVEDARSQMPDTGFQTAIG